MSPRIYASVWVFYFAFAGILWFAGLLSMLAIVVFGFSAFGLVFLGMMCVLPSAVSHPHEAETSASKRLQSAAKTRKPSNSAHAAQGFGSLKSA
ncbi:hypothetical protein BH10ACI2_BH10ACI2_07200 [soil metagenome]